MTDFFLFVFIIEDSYSAPPENTVTDPNATVYEAAKPPKKPTASYGPPNYVPPPVVKVKTPAPAVTIKQVVAPPRLVQTFVPPPVVKKVVHKLVAPVQKFVAPIQKFVAPVQKFVAPAPVYQQYAPVVQTQYAPAAPVYHRYAPAAPVIQKFVAPAPVVKAVAPLSPYAGAVGYHTYSSSAHAYDQSYGAPGFHVTSSRKYNKVIHPVAYAQPQQKVIHATAPVVQTYAPQAKYVAPKVAVVAQQGFVSLPPPSPLVQKTTAVVKEQSPGFFTPHLTPKKKHPLVFAYSYDQGASKVSHSYSGSGW